MAREKRTKPCSNCKKSKVKCIYTEVLPCERCVKTGQAAHCSFAPKLPNLRLPVIRTEPIYSGLQNDLVLPPFNPISTESSIPPPIRHPLPSAGHPLPPETRPQLTPRQSASAVPLPPHAHPSTHHSQHSSQAQSHAGTPPPHMNPTAVFNTAPTSMPPEETRWKDQMENTMNNFDNKLSDLVDVLKSNQKLLLEQQEQINIQQNNMNYYMNRRPSYQALRGDTNSPGYAGQIPLSRQISSDSNSSNRSSSSTDDSPHKRRRLDKFTLEDDFRDTVITQEDAVELFDYFDKNITPQLFGFEISKFSVKNIWETSPILICTICTISSMHHPKFHKVSQQLSKHLHKLCGELIYQGRPKTEMDGFNTILALIFCSFWLSDSQMFTGLALQMAKEIGLDGPQPKDSNLNSKDRLKLWYLLYVLDGQQSLTYNRQPLVNSHDYSIQHSRSLLLTNDKTIEDNKDVSVAVATTTKGKDGQAKSGESNDTSMVPQQTFTDLRLVSQVEYNQALSAAFKGNAWELLAPSSLGIPSKSNLELDKWMVSWTVLLSPMNNGAVWSSKSTLIYYNFAKMHINSSAVRGLQTETPQGKGEFPKLYQLKETNKIGPANPPPSSPNPEDPEKDWEDSSDDEEFISNKELVSRDQSAIDANIAFNAAQTVLKLVLNDKDIRSNLKYVPVHVHIMLYYAALLLAEDQSQAQPQSPTTDLETYKELIVNLGFICSLRKVVEENFPVDKHFGERLMSSLEELIEETFGSVKKKVNDAPLPKQDRDSLLHQLSALQEDSDKFELFESNRSRSSSPGAIYAWPGSNHGHPSHV